MKILLVDDEKIALKALKKRVDWLHYGFTEVFEAQSLTVAREILQKERIDCLLCDIELPGENGLELIAYVRDTYPDVQSVMVTCHAEFSYVQQALRFGARDYILKPIDYDELGRLLEKLLAERQEKTHQEQTRVLVEKTKQKKADQYEETDSNEVRIRRIKDYIEEHIREKITMRMLADQLHMNEQHLMRIFKKETGQSVVDYITGRRVAIAGRLLKETDYSINFIADCVGCENYSYFTKLFKKQTGVTPSEYREQFKK